MTLLTTNNTIADQEGLPQAWHQAVSDYTNDIDTEYRESVVESATNFIKLLLDNNVFTEDEPVTMTTGVDSIALSWTNIHGLPIKASTYHTGKVTLSSRPEFDGYVRYIDLPSIVELDSVTRVVGKLQKPWLKGTEFDPDVARQWVTRFTFDGYFDDSFTSINDIVVSEYTPNEMQVRAPGTMTVKQAQALAEALIEAVDYYTSPPDILVPVHQE